MKLYFVFFYLLMSFRAFGQTSSTIASGRPGQAIPPQVVGTQVFQIQTGFDRSTKEENSGLKTESLIFNNVIRYGMSESFEWNHLLNFQYSNFSDSSLPSTNGLSDLRFGFRYNLIAKPQGFIPSLGIQTQFKLTSVDSDYQTDHLAPVIQVSVLHQLCPQLSLTNNVGVSYDGLSPIEQYDLISALTWTVDDIWSVFIEAYGNIKDQYGSAYLDAGGAFVHSKDLQFDLSAGWGHNRQVTDHFISLGVSWRHSPEK